MAISAAEAKSLLGQTTQADTSAISPEEAQSLLSSSAPDSISDVLKSRTQPRFIRPEEAIQKAGGIIPFLRAGAGRAGAIPAGAVQESARIGKNIFGTLPAHRFNLPPSTALQLSKLIPQKSQQIQQQLIQQHPQQARAGRILGNLATYGGLAGALAPAEGVAPIVGKGLKYGAKGLGAIAKGIAVPFKAPKTILTGQLAKLIERGYGRLVDKGKALYETAFKGTKGVTPKISDATESNFKELREEAYPGKRNDVQVAFENYFGKVNEKGKIIKEPDESLENLHFLKSNLNKVKRDLDAREIAKQNFGTKDQENQRLLSETMDNISKDLEGNFKDLSPQKNVEYRKAQDHHKNNVVPFEDKIHKSVRELLLNPKRPVSKRLYTDLMQDNTETNRVRNLLGLSKGQLGLSRLLHSKLVTYPAVGAGLLYGGKKVL